VTCPLQRLLGDPERLSSVGLGCCCSNRARPRSDLDKIIDLSALNNYGVPNQTPVDGGVGISFRVVLNNDTA
jgi:hypothetical protein